MTLRVLYISLTGILVVFAFLLLMFFILTIFKNLFYKKEKGQDEELNTAYTSYKNDTGEKTEEEIAAILTVVKNYNPELKGKRILVEKRG